MCYKSPGPRCTPHALSALRKAQAEYLSNITYDNYVALRQAQDAYDLTPGGQQDIRDAMEREEDFAKRYELQQRLEHAVDARKEAISRINGSDKGDFHEGEEVSSGLTPSIKDGLPVDPLPKSKLKANLYSTLSYCFEYEYDYAQCEFSDCGSNGEMCRDTIYVGTSIKRTNEKSVLASRWGVDENAIPTEMVDALQKFGMYDYVDVDVNGGYYGQELSVHVDERLEDFVNELYFSQPNAAGPELEYARQEGVDTTGLKPGEAIKKTVNSSSFSAPVKKRLQQVSMAEARSFKFENIVVPKKHPASLGEYDYSSATPDKHAAGVVIAVGSKLYLVGGFDRFEAAKKTGKKTWKFNLLY